VPYSQAFKKSRRIRCKHIEVERDVRSGKPEMQLRAQSAAENPDWKIQPNGSSFDALSPLLLLHAVGSRSHEAEELQIDLLVELANRHSTIRNCNDKQERTT
jgi:hypothetical protein